MLGAGMDTRPWRMQLPPGVRWLEVDMPEVVAAKRRQLEQLGVALGARPAGPEATAPAAHPLAAASWTALSTDLGRPGWGAALRAAGLDPRHPTVWVAEGGRRMPRASWRRRGCGNLQGSTRHPLNLIISAPAMPAIVNCPEGTSVPVCCAPQPPCAFSCWPVLPCLL